MKPQKSKKTQSTTHSAVKISLAIGTLVLIINSYFIFEIYQQKNADVSQIHEILLERKTDMLNHEYNYHK